MAGQSVAHLRLVSRSRRTFAFLALFSSITVTLDPALGSAALETFGPGHVHCERLGEGDFDCLLTSLRITQGGNNVATFSLAVLPPAEQTLFEEWCSSVGDDCTVNIQGTKETAEGSRLATVTSIRWTRLQAPRNQAAARAVAHRSALNARS